MPFAYSECAANLIRSGQLREKMESLAKEDQEIAEQKLWRAVIASTVAEWIHGPLRRQREAEQFLFRDDKDYLTVCFSAGIDPGNLRSRLQKFRPGMNARAVLPTSWN